MKVRTICGVMVILWVTGMVGCGKTDKPSAGDMARLRSENQTERKAASRAILEQRARTIGELEKIVRDFVGEESRKGSAKTAVVLLGKLRAVEAVALLAENISVYVFYKSTKRIQSLEDAFPCVGALSEIGKPSIAAMIGNLASSEDEKVRELSARVILNVEGTEIGRIVIEKAIEDESDPTKKARLRAAVEYMQAAG